ncbi:MAG: FecR domain-containing protein [Bacteroidota bacterium]
MNNSFHDETLLARWLSNELTAEELVQLKQREDFADLQSVVEGMKSLEPPAFSEEASWQKLQAKRKILLPEEEEPEEEKKEAAAEAANTEETAAKTIAPITSPVAEVPVSPPAAPAAESRIRAIGRRQTMWMYAMAAAVALVLVALFWLRNSGPNYSTMIATGVGELQKVTLPDGSALQLNAKSSVGYNEEDWPDERNVYLAGEGFFRAKKGQTFVVLTEQGKVSVVGTQFNVFARDNELDVKCTEGRVQVFNQKESEKVLVRAGEQVSVINGKMQKRKGIDFTPKWFRGESVFQSAPRKKVFKEIERQFGVVVLGDGLKEELFSGKFVNDDLDKALRMVTVPMNLKYEVKADTVRLWKK